MKIKLKKKPLKIKLEAKKIKVKRPTAPWSKRNKIA